MHTYATIASTLKTFTKEKVIDRLDKRLHFKLPCLLSTTGTFHQNKLRYSGDRRRPKSAHATLHAEENFRSLPDEKFASH